MFEMLGGNANGRCEGRFVDIFHYHSCKLRFLKEWDYARLMMAERVFDNC